MSPFVKSISVIFLTGLLLVRALVVPAILMDFELRKDYIIKYYCENRNRPELHCDGKCYLAKKLKATQESQEKEASQRLLTQVLEVPDQLSHWQFTFEAPDFESTAVPFPFSIIVSFLRLKKTAFSVPPGLKRPYYLCLFFLFGILPNTGYVYAYKLAITVR
ncbi:hypothetical protein BWI96_07640 [Siphonobacter sp. SORGH_AS_0500]|uniref:hypothetical protein n=1 Tax=Siphonobacter sp. SORGH_AS_0500 TaxID=1864824 RepID=UPI000CCA0D65|nr:hypothetical protein [Siphonobacter sp. SORGH_AS_0500]PKK37211.1 hypothetical protein BWI96_07640 [Siphonobacter sp. SORGH_AS_0500]